MAISLLDRPIYGYSDVDRLVGLPGGTARRWLEGDTRGGVSYDPVLRPERSGSDAVTWGEMVEARLLAGFRGRNVSMQRMRPAIVRLREELGDYPLARATPFLLVEGRELVRVVQDEVGLNRELQLVVVRDGQLLLTDAAENFSESVVYDQGVAARLRPEQRTPLVQMDPARSFGQPTVRNVATESLAEDYRAGATREQLVQWYELRPEQVEDALRFELIAGAERAA